MLVKDISLDDPRENVLYDEVLLKMAEKGQSDEVLRFWESKEYFIVLGLIGKEEEDVHLENAQADNIEIIRRASGGGTVLQGKGCLNYSLVLSKEKTPEAADLKKSYQFILGKVVAALENINVKAQYLPISDIALVESEKKISGNAQKRGRKFILHHGTILYDFDLKKIEQYLKMPKDIPDYRKGRSHLDFVTNANISAEDFKRELKNIFNVSQESAQLSADEYQLLKE